jgi:hypothetical protein
MQSQQPGSWKSVTSFVLGMISLGAWILPICGGPLTITGLVLGILGITGNAKRGTAIAGVILCGIGLLITTANAAYGAYLGATGQIQWFNGGN